MSKLTIGVIIILAVLYFIISGAWVIVTGTKLIIGVVAAVALGAWFASSRK